MTLPTLLAGATILTADAVGRNRVAVTFRTSYADRLWQLYVGRRWIGTTNSTTDRRVSGVVIPSIWPEPISLVGVDPINRITDFGQALHDKPYNRRRLSFSVASTTDFDRVDVTRSIDAGEDVDEAEVVASIKIIPTSTRYVMDLPQLTRRGEWEHHLWSVDSKPTSGNRTHFATTTIPAAVYPRDFIGEQRFEVASIASRVVSLRVEYPSE